MIVYSWLASSLASGATIWPVQCLGDGHLNEVSLTDGHRIWEEACDMLACGFHLVPNTELALLLGCAMDGAFVRVDLGQRTSLANVFCAGEPTGMGGVEAALAQGKVAGLCAAETGMSFKATARVRRHHAFAKHLDKAFSLRTELLSLARPETIVCRCEDVSYAQLDKRHGWTDAKCRRAAAWGPARDASAARPCTRSSAGRPAPSALQSSRYPYPRFAAPDLPPSPNT